MNAEKLIRHGARLLVAGMLALPIGAGLGCSIYRNDRCYVDDARYDLMRQIFIQSGAVDMVKREMERLQWARCEKNEVLYRISKEFEVPGE